MKGKDEKDCQCRGKMTRRGFLQLVGVGAVASAVPGKLGDECRRIPRGAEQAP